MRSRTARSRGLTGRRPEGDRGAQGGGVRDRLRWVWVRAHGCPEYGVGAVEYRVWVQRRVPRVALEHERASLFPRPPGAVRRSRPALGDDRTAAGWPPGGVWTSVLIRPDLPLSRAPPLTLGRRVRVETGWETGIGKAVGVDSPGTPLVDTGAGTVEVHAGDRGAPPGGEVGITPTDGFFHHEGV